MYESGEISDADYQTLLMDIQSEGAGRPTGAK
jgi:hypothetical protein